MTDVVIGGVKVPSTVSLFLNYVSETNCVEAKKAIDATQQNLLLAYESPTITYKEVRRREALMFAARDAFERFGTPHHVRAILEDYWDGVRE